MNQSPNAGPQTTLFAAIFNRLPDPGTTNQYTPLAVLEFDPGETDLVVNGGSVFKALPTPLDLPAGFQGVIAAWGYLSRDQTTGSEAYGDAETGAPAWSLAPAGGQVSFLAPVYGPENAPGSYPSIRDKGVANEYAAGTFQFQASQQGSNFVPVNNPANAAFGGTLGMQFDVNSDVLVTSLGVYVDSQTSAAFRSGALPDRDQLFAAIFDRDTGNLLGQATFAPGDPNLVQYGSSLYLTLQTPLLLQAGFHGVIGAWGYMTQGVPNSGLEYADAFTNTPPWTLSTGAGLITPLQPLQSPDDGSCPTTPDKGASNEYAAGSFQFAAPSYFQVDPTPADDPGPAVFGPNDTLKIVTRNFVVGGYLALGGSVQNGGSASPDGLLAAAAPSGLAPGATVTLLQDGKVVATTTVDANGDYQFVGLKPGKYTVQETVPAGYREASALLPDQSFLAPQLANLFGGKPYQTLSAALVDLNDDGTVDLAAIVLDPSSGLPLLVVSPGNGGTYGAPVFVSGLALGSMKVVAADLNGDGEPDLAVLRGDGTIDLFTNQGKLQFGLTSSYFSLSSAVGAGVTAVDMAGGAFDQDGTDGLAVAYAGGTAGLGGVVIFRPGMTPVNFTLPQVPGAVAVGDVNGNGTPDVVVNDGTALAIVYCLPLTHIFQLKLVATDLTGLPGPVAIANLNGDSRPDILAAAGGQVEYFRQNIGSFFGVDLGTVPAGVSIRSLITEDFNGDGMVDVAVLLSDGRLALYQDHASTGLTTDELPQLSSPVPAALGMTAGDVNSDGRPDLLLWTSQGLNVLQNQVTLTPASQTATLSPRSSASLDFVNISTGLISGIVFHDVNRTGSRDAADQGMPGVLVFLDIADTGVYDPAVDPSTTTSALGEYTFDAGLDGSPLPDGQYRVGVVTGAGYVQTGASGLRNVNVTGGAPTGPVDFGLADRLLGTVAASQVETGASLSLNLGTPADAGHQLVFHLDAGGLAGVGINNDSGLVTVNVPLNQAVGTYMLTVRATDPFDPTQTESESLTVAVTSLPNVAYFQAIYRTVLGRPADNAGLTFWVGQLGAGASRTQVAAGFWGSAEHLGLEVDSLYATYLHRVPDQAGRAFWVHALATGTSVQDLSARFLLSTEYSSTHADTASFISGLYADVLGRMESAAEAEFWGALAASSLTREEVARFFLTSPEQARHTVESLYSALLGRAADPNGLMFWTSNLQSGQLSADQIGEAMIASDEFFQ